MKRSVLSPLLCAVVACAGCASMLGIDHEYVRADEQDSGIGGATGAGESPPVIGGGSPSGAGGSHVVVESGGDPSVDSGPPPVMGNGAAAAMEAGACNPALCGAGTKCCAYSAVCVAQAPIIGCGLPSCDPCPPPPANGIAICANDACAVHCNDGYALQGASCVPVTTGSGGATGTGGNPGTGGAAKCNPDDCPGCSLAGPAKCCRNDDTCGCSWAPGFVCY